MAELADARDSKSRDLKSRVGSTPTPGTSFAGKREQLKFSAKADTAAQSEGRGMGKGAPWLSSDSTVCAAEAGSQQNRATNLVVSLNPAGFSAGITATVKE